MSEIVYVVKCEGTNKIKIGVTGNNIIETIQSLQEGNPNKLILLGCVETEQPSTIIHFLYDLFKDYNCENGWLSYDDETSNPIRLYNFPPRLNSVKSNINTVSNREKSQILFWHLINHYEKQEIHKIDITKLSQEVNLPPEFVSEVLILCSETLVSIPSNISQFPMIV